MNYLDCLRLTFRSQELVYISLPRLTTIGLKIKNWKIHVYLQFSTNKQRISTPTEGLTKNSVHRLKAYYILKF